MLHELYRLARVKAGYSPEEASQVLHPETPLESFEQGRAEIPPAHLALLEALYGYEVKEGELRPKPWPFPRERRTFPPKGVVALQIWVDFLEDFAEFVKREAPDFREVLVHETTAPGFDIAYWDHPVLGPAFLLTHTGRASLGQNLGWAFKRVLKRRWDPASEADVLPNALTRTNTTPTLKHPYPVLHLVFRAALEHRLSPSEASRLLRVDQRVIPGGTP